MSIMPIPHLPPESTPPLVILRPVLNLFQYCFRIYNVDAETSSA